MKTLVAFLTVLVIAVSGLAQTGDSDSILRYEYLREISPDLKYGVLEIKNCGKSRMERKNAPIMETRLVEILDLKQSGFRNLCQLPDSMLYCTFHDSVTLAIVTVPNFDDSPALSELLLFDLQRQGARTSLHSVDVKSPNNDWKTVLTFGMFKMKDSLVVYMDPVDSSTGEIAMTHTKTVVRCMTCSDSMPVVASIPMTLEPVFSLDGRSVLASRLDRSMESAALIRYDLDRHTATELKSIPFFWHAPQCASSESPIYYLGLGAPFNTASENIWRYDPVTDENSVLTDYSEPQQVTRFYLTPDSIVYEVETTLSNEYTLRWESLSIRP
ncbi:MAG: hypothetical protein AB1483_08985 [Candidatus Zixiibacteriota bacterium]